MSFTPKLSRWYVMVAFEILGSIWLLSVSSCINQYVWFILIFIRLIKPHTPSLSTNMAFCLWASCMAKLPDLWDDIDISLCHSKREIHIDLGMCVSHLYLSSTGQYIRLNIPINKVLNDLCVSQYMHLLY